MMGQSPQREPNGHVRVGQIVGHFGLKGTLKVAPLTDFPDRFTAGSLLYLDGRAHEILGAHWHKSQVRVHLEGIESIEEAQQLKWRYLTVPESARPALGGDEFMTSDLVGLEVWERGSLVGRVSEVAHTSAHDLICVGQTMIPCVHEFVKSIDLAAGRIEVELIEGMRGAPVTEENI